MSSFPSPRCWISLTAMLTMLGLPGSAFSVQQPSATEAAPAATASPVADTRVSEIDSKAASASAAAGTPASTEPSKKEVKKREIPWARRPYNVAVSIGFDGPETQSPRIRAWLVGEIRKGFERMYGPMWNAQVAASDWLIPASAHRLQRLSEPELLARYPESTPEKVMLIAVSGSRNAFEVSCREYDSRIQELSPLLSEQTNDSQNVSNIACRLARDCFRPVLMLAGQTPDKSELEFFLQAGALIPPDPSAAQIAEGDVLRTFLRQMDRRNPDQVKLVQRMDLCYVRVSAFNQELHVSTPTPEDLDVVIEGQTADSTEVHLDSGHVRGVLISHGLVGFGGKSRSSTQQIALRQRPSAKSSRVRLVLQPRPDRPLICYRVDKVAKLRHTDASETENVRSLTDRNGAIEIEVDTKNPTFWLYVYSGSLLLARVPYAPGLIPEDTIKLPDDTLRLSVEGELYLLRDQIVDMVAQKAVYMSLARKGAAAGDLPAVEAAIASLDALPDQAAFEAKLNEIRSPAVEKADQQKNPGVRRKIETLCRKMGESLTDFFATDKRLKEAEELNNLRESAESGVFTPAAPETTPAP